jgi:serine/threonine protein kinase
MTDALREAYRDLKEIDRRREGIRFAATLPDGTPVIALALAPEVSARIVSQERFDAEFQRAAAVHHEGLVPPVAWGALSDGTLHCAYARVDSQEIVPGSLTPAIVASAGAKVARALGAAHSAGVLHGAVMATRMIFTPDRGVLLGDVGLFAALSEGGLGAGAAVELLSAAAYVSPEVQNGQPPNISSDIYSLGASLYELLTGKPPYGGRMTSYVLASVLSEEIEEGNQPAPDAATKDLSVNPVVDALMRAIERAPEDRWPTAEAFASALAAGVPTGEMAVKAKTRRGCLPAAAVIVIATSLIGTLVR